MAYRIVFGVCGASGMPLAKAVLAAFASVPDLECHLIISTQASRVLEAECEVSAEALGGLAAASHEPGDLSAGPASGSWQHNGMVICPCTMSSLAAIAGGYGSNLIHRAADVSLKERRPLIRVTRETPLSLIHINNMQAATQAGACIMPFMPAFYSGETTLAGLMRHFAGRLLDQLHIPHTLCARWRNNQ